MHITLLCNAGLAITHGGQTLLVDVPNEAFAPFCSVSDSLWQQILDRRPPYDHVCGLYFTHTHPDHCHRERAEAYHQKWPELPVFFPEDYPEKGTVVFGSFILSYQRMDHAPMDEPVPPHVVTWIRAGEKSLYIAADAKLDLDAHICFLKGRQANGAFWNSMYLSRPETRQLMQYTGRQNFIYHMPKENPDGFGLWSKCQKNQQRYGAELSSVTVLDAYPYEIDL